MIAAFIATSLMRRFNTTYNRQKCWFKNYLHQIVFAAAYLRLLRPCSGVALALLSEMLDWSLAVSMLTAGLAVQPICDAVYFLFAHWRMSTPCAYGGRQVNMCFKCRSPRNIRCAEDLSPTRQQAGQGFFMFCDKRCPSNAAITNFLLHQPGRSVAGATVARTALASASFAMDKTNGCGILHILVRNDSNMCGRKYQRSKPSPCIEMRSPRCCNRYIRYLCVIARHSTLRHLSLGLKVFGTDDAACWIFLPRKC
eukprot:8314-Heterococcus_DN1.PRE.5